MSKISVIISTRNNFKKLLDVIASVEQQTYKNVEIIIVNDGSTQKKYYTHKFKHKIIHLAKSTFKMFGYNHPNYLNSVGINHATGKYITFCSDYNYLFPKKLEIQMGNLIDQNIKANAVSGYSKINSYNNNKKLIKAHDLNLCGVIIDKNLINDFKWTKCDSFFKLRDFFTFTDTPLYILYVKSILLY